jgi:hypothetical protein
LFNRAYLDPFANAALSQRRVLFVGQQIIDATCGEGLRCYPKSLAHITSAAHAEQPEDDDQGKWHTQQPEKNQHHGFLLSVKGLKVQVVCF